MLLFFSVNANPWIDNGLIDDVWIDRSVPATGESVQPAPLITLGIGPGGSILYLMTGGLDMVGGGTVWIDNSPASTVWN